MRDPTSNVGRGLVFGAGVGMAFGAAFGRVGIGLTIGAAIGFVIGAVLDARAARTRRPDEPPPGG